MKIKRLTPPAPTPLKQELLERDPPTTLVHHLDDIEVQPRIIRMSPRAAVAWCYVDSVGQMGKLHIAEPYIRRADNGWMCGPFWAQERSQ